MNTGHSPTAAQQSASAQAAPRGAMMLQAIAALKLFEALVLCATGVAALELLRPDITQALEDWTALLPLGSEQQHLAQHLLNSLTGLGPHRIKELGIGVFAYAALFVVEGIGLLRRKRWAEWVTVLSTALLVPLELWELAHHATLPKLAALLINLLVVWYLVRRIRNTPHHGTAPQPQAPGGGLPGKAGSAQGVR